MTSVFLTEAEKKRKAKYNAIVNLYNGYRKKADDTGEEISENRIINIVAQRANMSGVGVRKILVAENIIKKNANVGRPKRS